MLDRFVKILDYSFEMFEDSLVIDIAKFDGQCLELKVSLHFEEEDNGVEKRAVWKFNIYGVRQHKIVLGNCFSFEYCDESVGDVLKWKHMEPSYSVSFYGKVDNPMMVIGRLYEFHSKTVRNQICFDEFLNMPLDLEKLISGGFGLLAAQVPKQLAVAYKSALEESGISVTLSDVTPPVYWDGEKRTTGIVPLSVLILGESEIIAEKIEANEVEVKEIDEDAL